MNWLDLDDLDLIFKVRRGLRFWKMAPRRQRQHTYRNKRNYRYISIYFNNMSVQTGWGHTFSSENTVLFNIKLIGSEDSFTKHVTQAIFLSGKMINENLLAINRIKEQFVQDRPIYLHELSKLLIYDFLYNYLLNKNDKKILRLMFADNDSLVYEIKTEDAYKDLYEKKEDQKYFDTCDYPKKQQILF